MPQDFLQNQIALRDEFEARPVGHHSPELQRLLNLLRASPFENKYVLVCTKPHEEWTLGQLSGKRGTPVKLLRGQVFRNWDDAEKEIFRRRWRATFQTDVIQKAEK